MNNLVEKLKAHLATEDGHKEAVEYFERIRKENEIKEKQLERFHSKINSKKDFEFFVEKVISKYESDKYKDFWWKRYCEPPKSLYFFLFKYAKKYGREANRNEYQKYANMFTAGIYTIHGYYFNLMNGQGSCILISKNRKYNKKNNI